MLRTQKMSLARATSIVCVYLFVFGVTGTDAADACRGKNITGQYIPHEKRLLECLLKDYNPDVRPALYPDDVVNVTMDSVSGTVVNLNIKTSVLTTEVWLMQSWTDPQLSWNPTSFGGVNEIRIPIASLWTPNIVLYNNADESFKYIQDKLAIVSSSGVVQWFPHGRLRSWCPCELRLFPFDTQRCVLTFGSWSYDVKLVKLQLAQQSTKERRFLPKAYEWDVMDYQANVIDLAFGGVSETGAIVGFKDFQLVTFTFSMKRTSVYFKYMIVGPSVILAVLTLVLYWVPVQTGERFMLASGVLVSIMMLLSILEGYLPEDIWKLPVVASYICYNLVFLVITIIISIVVFNCYHRDMKRKPVPRLVRTIFLGLLAKMCHVSTSLYTSLPGGTSYDEPIRQRELRDARVGRTSTLTTHDAAASATTTHGAANSTADPPGRGGQTSTMEQTLDDIRHYLRVLATKPEMESAQPLPASHREIVVGEWQRVALVIDRASFCLFLLISIAVTMSLYAHV